MKIKKLEKVDTQYFNLPNDLMKFLLIIRETQYQQELKINEMIEKLNKL
jgi:hypothetical protein